MKIINQKKYGNIEIDNSEKDVILIWLDEGRAEENELVIIERESIQQLINILNAEI